MREIIFRAKVKDKNELIGKGFRIDENGNLKSEWVFGVPIPHYPDLFLAWNEACNEYEEVTIIPETVGQYTGMTDKNGLTKIFEYDIIDANGRKVGNYYENSNLLKDGTCFLVAKMGTKEWSRSEQEAIKRGCKYAE